MNRNLAPSKGNMYRGVIGLESRLDLPAGGGSVSTTTVGLAGDQSVATAGWTRTAAGKYKWALKEPVLGPVFVQLTLEKATAEALWVELDTVDATNVTAPSITIRTIVAAGTATDCTNACKVHVSIRAVDTSTGITGGG